MPVFDKKPVAPVEATVQVVKAQPQPVASPLNAFNLAQSIVGGFSTMFARMKQSAVTAANATPTKATEKFMRVGF